MANVNCVFSAHVVDDDGEKTSTPFFRTLADTVTLANLVSYGDLLATDLDATLDAKVYKIRVCLEFEPTSVKANPVAGSEIERTGLFNMDLTGQVRSFGIDVPGIAQSVLDGNKINLEDTAVATLMSLLNSYTDPFHNAIQGVNSGVKTFRKHRKQTRRV